MGEMMDAALAVELAGLMRNRSNVYSLLSRAFEVEADAAFVRELVQDFAFESDSPKLVSEMDAMRSCLKDIDEGGLEQLAVVFDRVFFGMGPLTAKKAFPYESVYTSQKGLLMQDAYSEVVKIYRGMRLRKDERFTEPEDHIAVELAFMKELSDRACDALERRDEDAAADVIAAQEDFLQDHLLNWVDRFAADCREAAGEGFYAHLASFTAAFLAEDAGVLSEVLG